MATILSMRCKGMTMSRSAAALLPWLYLVVSFLIFLAVFPLTAAQVMRTFDRYLGAHFFDTQAGGSAVLWMHFFWIFGHPEVYGSGAARLRFCQRDYSGLLPQSDVRIYGHGVGERGDRLHQPQCLGAPYVYGWTLAPRGISSSRFRR